MIEGEYLNNTIRAAVNKLWWDYIHPINSLWKYGQAEIKIQYHKPTNNKSSIINSLCAKVLLDEVIIGTLRSDDDDDGNENATKQ